MEHLLEGYGSSDCTENESNNDSDGEDVKGATGSKKNDPVKEPANKLLQNSPPTHVLRLEWCNTNLTVGLEETKNNRGKQDPNDNNKSSDKETNATLDTTTTTTTMGALQTTGAHATVAEEATKWRQFQRVRIVVVADDVADKSLHSKENARETPTIVGNKRKRSATAAMAATGMASSGSLHSSLSSCFVRTKPHVTGNWAGHVFIPLVPSSFAATATAATSTCCGAAVNTCQRRLRHYKLWKRVVQRSMRYIQEKLVKQRSPDGNNNNNNDNYGDDGANRVHATTDSANTELVLVQHNVKQLHLSLSRPFYLQAGSIDSFVQALTMRLSCFRKILGGSSLSSTSRIQLQTHPRNIQVFVNDEQTRSFFAWPVTAAAAAATVATVGQASSPSLLLRLISIVNDVLQDYGQSTYYDNPRFHVSFASCPGTILLASTAAVAEEEYASASDVDNNKRKKKDDGDKTNSHGSDNDSTSNSSCSMTSCTEGDCCNKNSKTTSCSDDNDNDTNEDDESDEDDDNDESQDEDVSNGGGGCDYMDLALDEIHCTFGTTKSFILSLRG